MKKRGSKKLDSPNFRLDKQVDGTDADSPAVYKAGFVNSQDGTHAAARRDFFRGLLGAGGAAAAASSLSGCGGGDGGGGDSSSTSSSSMCERRYRPSHTAGIVSVGFSNDGSKIVSGALDNTVKVWTVADAKLSLPIHTDAVYSVAFSSDRANIFSLSRSSSNNASIRVWNASSGNLVSSTAGLTGGVYSAAYSPDGSKIVSASFDKTVKIWNASNGNLIVTCTGHTDSVYSVAFSPDGTKIVSGSADKTVKVWNASSGNLIATSTGHTGSVNSVTFSTDGSKIVSGGGICCRSRRSACRRRRFLAAEFGVGGRLTSRRNRGRQAPGEEWVAGIRRADRR